MGGYALIQDNKVINMVLWDGKTEIDFGEGVTAVEMKDSDIVDKGYTYKNGKFIAPPPTEEEVADQALIMRQSNIAQKSTLFNEASTRISVLQDAVDLEMSTSEEAAALPKWKKYRVLLSRIGADTSEPVEWPQKPDF